MCKIDFKLNLKPIQNRLQRTKQHHNVKLINIKSVIYMSKLNELAYFLNSMKETLPFNDEKDFSEKIVRDKAQGFNKVF